MKVVQPHHAAMAKSVRKQYRPTYLREWRKFRHLTLEQLAGRVDMKASALSMLERGQSGYTQQTLERLAEALNTEPASLIMRDPINGNRLWSIWDDALPAEKQQIEAVADALVKSRRKAG